MQGLLVNQGAHFEVRAMLLGDRIDLRALETTACLATTPLTVSVQSGGIAVLFRYGVIVLFDVAPMEEADFLARLEPLISNRYPSPEMETVKVHVDGELQEGLRGETIVIAQTSVQHMQIIADILAKSVILARYETQVARNFERIEPLAVNLERKGHGGRQARVLLQHIGSALLSEHTMVGRVEVSEKPEVLWEHPELESFYLRLEDEFEIRERHVALERKLGLISRTAETLLELLQNRRSLRVEWYIVILIVVEIFISLYEIVFMAH